MITVEDVKHVVNMVVNDNRGNVLTEAMCRGIEEAVGFYCSRLDADTNRSIALANQESKES